MIIREYKKEDEEQVKKVIYGALCEIYGQTKIDWEDFSKYAAFYVAEENGEIIGTAALKEIDNQLIKLKRMYILPSLQRKGVGAKLLKKCINFSKKGGFKKMILTTYPEMKGAVIFYEKNGFQIVENPSAQFFTNPKLKEYNERQVAMEKEI
jgi:putative acetyltransferase